MSTPIELGYVNDPWGNPEFYIQKIGTKYFIINTAGLIVKEFTTQAAAEQYLEMEPA